TGVRRTGPLPARMTEQRQRVVAAAGEAFAWPVADLAQEAGVSSAVVRGLVDCGTLETCGLPALAPFEMLLPESCGPKLSCDQPAGADQLRATQRAGGCSVTLVDGVTGSGKTEVYLGMVAEALVQGRQVLVLLPEIALTGQFIERIERRFGA